MVQAIVTGGAVRVGKAVCLALADAGYDIILIFNNSLSDAQQATQEIKSKNRQCHLHRCDLSRKENIDTLFADLSRKYDDITLLVNNAAIFEKYSFSETSEQIFDHHMNINLKAPFFLTQNFVQYINKRPYINSGHVINVIDSRVNGIHTGHFAYHLSKKALNDLTKMLAKELAPKIRVNSVALGKILPHKSDAENIDFNKYPKVKLVTEAILKLNSSNDLTGQNIIIESDTNLEGYY